MKPKAPEIKSTPPPNPSLNCKIQNQGTTQAPVTVGQKLELVCPIQGTLLTSSSQVKFANQDKGSTYAIEFLGKPAVSGETLIQSVTSYKVGDHNFESVTLSIDGKTLRVSPFKIDVRTVLPNPAPQGQAPAQGQEQSQVQQPTPFPIFDPEKVPAPWWWWAIWIGLGVLILAFFTWQIVKWLKERKNVQAQTSAPKLTPKETFLSRLRKLESRELHQKGEFKSFALELTNILKTTMGSHLGFAAEDMTSEEVIATLERRHKVFFGAAGQVVAHVFAELDQIKFAKIETSTEKCMSLLDASRVIGRDLFGDHP